MGGGGLWGFTTNSSVVSIFDSIYTLHHCDGFHDYKIQSFIVNGDIFEPESVQTKAGNYSALGLGYITIHCYSME